MSTNISTWLSSLALIVIGISASIVTSSTLESENDTYEPIKPMTPWKMDPIDSCLFACNMCYRTELMLDCANKVCLMALPSGKPLGKVWASTCPGLYSIFKR